MERNELFLIALAVAVSLICWACGDNGGETTDVGDTDNVGDLSEEDQGGDPVPDIAYEDGAGEFLGLEADSEEEEWGDCISGCHHPHDLAQVFELTDFPFDGLRGVIDDREHRYTYQSVEYAGPDLDIVAIRLPGRTMLEITVEPAGSESLIDPQVWTHDGIDYMTYNNDRSEGDVAARTVVAAPYVTELPFYFVVEDANNYDAMPSGPFVGGDDYAYIVRFRTWEFDPIELGELTAANSPLHVSGAQLEQAGDIHYYRFTAPAAEEVAQRPRVEFTRTGSSSFLGVLDGMRTIGGDLVWSRGYMVWDEENTGSLTLSGSAFTVCNQSSCIGTAEHIFIVMDWNGSAFPGDFTYDLDVVLP